MQQPNQSKRCVTINWEKYKTRKKKVLRSKLPEHGKIERALPSHFHQVPENALQYMFTMIHGVPT